MSKEVKRSSGDKFMMGVILIVIGVFFLMIQSDIIDWNNFWALILVLLGLAFFTGFLLDRKNFGLLMPATILTIIGVLFLYLSLTDWDQMEYLWPTFILAPGIGFFLMHFSTPKTDKLYIPGTILVVISLAFFTQFWQLFAYWPYFLIGIGVYLVLKYFGTRESE
jgi:hypothetical protein